MLITSSIFYYTPFKPLDFHQQSGDLTIASGLNAFLKSCGHKVFSPSRLRTRWIFWKPWLWPLVLRDRCRSLRHLKHPVPDLWLTYHTYYKAPDVLGPWVSRKLNIPYVIFQGIYSTKRKKKIKTLPGYILNRHALMGADHVFSNRREDMMNLKRLIPDDRLTYISPGIDTSEFSYDGKARSELRRLWKISRNDTVVFSAAMFRPGIKTQGLEFALKAFARLCEQDRSLHLVIAGDGKEREGLERLAQMLVPGRVRFLGNVPRNEMRRFYSACDVFAFPGIRETLGMVYLEAQACGLPVVAFNNGGIPEVVQNGITGFLTTPFDPASYSDAISSLAGNESLRKEMGYSAENYVKKSHDINRNYQAVETVLNRVVSDYRNKKAF